MEDAKGPWKAPEPQNLALQIERSPKGVEKGKVFSKLGEEKERDNSESILRAKMKEMWELFGSPLFKIN